MDSGKIEIDVEQYRMFKRIYEFCLDMVVEGEEVSDEGGTEIAGEFMRDLKEIVGECSEYLAWCEGAEGEDVH
jgi:hypothetical protein